MNGNRKSLNAYVMDGSDLIIIRDINNNTSFLSCSTLFSSQSYVCNINEGRNWRGGEIYLKLE